jgi:hypothetical protein
MGIEKTLIVVTGENLRTSINFLGRVNATFFEVAVPFTCQCLRDMQYPDSVGDSVILVDGKELRGGSFPDSILNRESADRMAVLSAILSKIHLYLVINEAKWK